VGLGSVRGRKFTLSPKVKVSVLGICVQYDTFVIVLLFPPLLKGFRLSLYSLDIIIIIIIIIDIIIILKFIFAY
jgi:hypothetical protein